MGVTDDLELYESDQYVDSYHSTGGLRIGQIVKHVKLEDSDQVIDFACGNGLLAPEISSSVMSYTGVDFSSNFIKRAEQLSEEKQLKNVKFVCQDIIDFVKENLAKYDKAFTLDFSEHLNDQNFLTIFEAIRNSLKDGGELIIHTPNLDFILEKLKDKGIMKQVSGHIGVRNFEMYKKLLENAGFSGIKVIYLPHYNQALRRLQLFSFLPLIGRYFKARLLITCQK